MVVPSLVCLSVLAAVALGIRAAPAATPMPTPPPTGGQALYDSNCAGCHGDPRTAGPAPAAPIKVAGARTCSIQGAINGTAVFPGGVPHMQFLKGLLSNDQILQISQYLNSFSVSGEQRYLAACSGCHGLDARGGRVGKGVRGEDGGEIREAIYEERAMRFLRCLPASDIFAIGRHLGGGREDHDDSDDEDHHDRHDR